jgi:methyl-accepting chemotaxis protein
MPKLDHDTLELLLIAVTAFCILFQTILLTAVFVAVRKGIKSLTDQVDDLRSSAMPVIDHTRDFVKRITPKVEETAKNVAEMSQTIKEHTTAVSASVSDITQKVNAQSSRVDAMVSRALDALDNAAGFVAETVDKPVRQLSGILASIKAIVETLGAYQPARRAPQPPAHGAAQSASGPADEYEPQSGPLL